MLPDAETDAEAIRPGGEAVVPRELPRKLRSAGSGAAKSHKKKRPRPSMREAAGGSARAEGAAGGQRSDAAVEPVFVDLISSSESDGDG